MTLIEFPNDVINELSSIRGQSEKGVQILAEAEVKYVNLELDADKAEYAAFLDAQGTVADRNAVSKLLSLEKRRDAELAKVEVNRVKTKLRQLSEALHATQTVGKMIELQWRTAGVGER
jgi:hypothetical protein